MNYTPHTEHDVQKMLEVIGVGSTDDLFAPIRESLRLRNLDLPPGLSEMEVVSVVQGLADRVRNDAPSVSFLGGGAYDHFSPSVVDAMISRGEFFTAYTPYQPEVSQGTLRAIFEFQSMICELTGMDVANA
ncbi:MAG: glycine dehydrogenase, partial [Candidatus Latescibacteria bacterium]|nr:glycine dehydrogenase [Candidatus Latescibacterota bacterium]